MPGAHARLWRGRVDPRFDPGRRRTARQGRLAVPSSPTRPRRRSIRRRSRPDVHRPRRRPLPRHAPPAAHTPERGALHERHGRVARVSRLRVRTRRADGSADGTDRTRRCRGRPHGWGRPGVGRRDGRRVRSSRAGSRRRGAPRRDAPPVHARTPARGAVQRRRGLDGAVSRRGADRDTRRRRHRGLDGRRNEGTPGHIPGSRRRGDARREVRARGRERYSRGDRRVARAASRGARHGRGQGGRRAARVLCGSGVGEDPLRGGAGGWGERGGDVRVRASQRAAAGRAEPGIVRAEVAAPQGSAEGQRDDDDARVADVPAVSQWLGRRVCAKPAHAAQAEARGRGEAGAARGAGGTAPQRPAVVDAQAEAGGAVREQVQRGAAKVG
mmetsp:Transcript_13877/g.60616  ORF Transcript_13877/g.60616 Transcript_13877/m.60616 type:complete len:385 (+) Transcript_13877:454-1608(+)